MMTLEKLTRKDLLAVWDRLRESDRRELALQGYTRRTVVRHLKYLGFCVKLDGEPIAAFGCARHGANLFYWCFGTQKVYGVWRRLTRIAKAFMERVARESPFEFAVVEVWENNKSSVRWLKRLGFIETEHMRYAGQERLRIMEYRGNN